MITRGIVEQVVDRYTVVVRMPMIDRVSHSTISTSEYDLDEAVVCVLPGFSPSLKVGDVVIVSVEPYDEEVTILGLLFCNHNTESVCDAKVNSLIVDGHTTLSTDCNIGSISYSEISKLHGVRENIQDQIDSLKEKISQLNKQLSIGGS